MASLFCSFQLTLRALYRLILDLSHPKLNSINDGISSLFCSLAYTKVDYIIPRILSSGRNTLLAKFYIEIAFRKVPVHPGDRHILGMTWPYIDAVTLVRLTLSPENV